MKVPAQHHWQSKPLAEIVLVLEDGNSVSDLEAPFASLDCS